MTVMWLVKFTSAARVFANEIILIQTGQSTEENGTLINTGRQFNDNSCPVARKGQGYSAKGVLKIKEDLLPAPRALLCLYGLSRQAADPNPRKGSKHVERTGYRRQSTLPLSS
ncbi:hypothetical protein DPMN_190863 [Dreissena polymorpha]|uniref:Secreted protein n=1 Tax=Dreissena polymorpha TaxID=45954 RepID=A0A9D3Y086_DREPO|nr:hypothetical protein DPMN_190863 [Dreissena polymorpha]